MLRERGSGQKHAIQNENPSVFDTDSEECVYVPRKKPREVKIPPQGFERDLNSSDDRVRNFQAVHESKVNVERKKPRRDEVFTDLTPWENKFLGQHGEGPLRVLDKIELQTSDLEGIRSPQGFLGENVMDAFVFLLNGRNKIRHFNIQSISRVYTYSVRFVRSLLSAEFDLGSVSEQLGKASRLTENVAKLLFPYLMSSGHCALFVADVERSSFFVYEPHDSPCKKLEEEVLPVIIGYLQSEAKKSRPRSASRTYARISRVNSWPVITKAGCLAKEDCGSCGLFVLWAMEHLERRVIPKFNVEDIHVLRQRLELFLHGIDKHQVSFWEKQCVPNEELVLTALNKKSGKSVARTNQEDGVKLHSDVVRSRPSPLRKRDAGVLTRSVKDSAADGEEVKKFIELFRSMQDIVLASEQEKEAVTHQQQNRRMRDVVAPHEALDGRLKTNGIGKVKQGVKGEVHTVCKPAPLSPPQNGGAKAYDCDTDVFDRNNTGTGSTVQVAGASQQSGVEGGATNTGKSKIQASEETTSAHLSTGVQTGPARRKSVSVHGLAQGSQAQQSAARTAVLSTSSVDHSEVKTSSMISAVPQASLEESGGTKGNAKEEKLPIGRVTKRRRVSKNSPQSHALRAGGEKKKMRKSSGMASDGETENVKQTECSVKEEEVPRRRFALRNSKGQFRAQTAKRADKTAGAFRKMRVSSKRKWMRNGERENMKKMKAHHNKTSNKRMAENAVEEAREVAVASSGEGASGHSLDQSKRKRDEETGGIWQIQDGDDGDDDDDALEIPRRWEDRTGSVGMGIGGKSTGRDGERAQSMQQLKQGGVLEVQVDDTDSAERVIAMETEQNTEKLGNVRQMKDIIVAEERNDAQQKGRAQTVNAKSGNTEAKMEKRGVAEEKQLKGGGLRKSVGIGQHLKQVEADNEEMKVEVRRVPMCTADISEPISIRARNDCGEKRIAEEYEIPREREEQHDERRWKKTKRVVEELRKSAAEMRNLGMVTQAENCMKKVIELLDDEAGRISRPAQSE